VYDKATVFAVGAIVGFCGEALYKSMLRPQIRAHLVLFDRDARPVILPAEADDVVIVRRADYAQERGMIDLRVCPN